MAIRTIILYLLIKVKIMKKILFLLTLVIIAMFLMSQTQTTRQKEVYYQDKFAEIIKGSTSVTLWDKTEVDILTDTFAIEVDFSEKWAESIGQSLYYAEMTNRKAGVLLVVNSNLDERFIRRLMTVAMRKDITVWLMDYTTEKWCKVDRFVEYSYSYEFK